MARYQVPPDPRQDDLAPHAHRVAGAGGRSSPPWLWIGLGAIVTVLAIAVAILWARLLLDVKPPEVVETPTIILQTAAPTPPPPTPTVAVSPDAAEPTSAVTPLVTAQPEPTQAPTPVPPGTFAVGIRVTVAGTAGAGVSLRAGPGTDNARLAIAQDGDVLEIVGGPEEGEDFTWWFVRTTDGTEAWVVQDFMRVP